MVPTVPLTPRSAAAAIVLASGAVLGVALYFQYVEGLAPCRLCIYQRYPYIGAIGLAVLSFGLGSWAARWLVASCGVLFAVGAAIALYHVGVEQGWVSEPGACAATATPGSLEALRAELLGAPAARCEEVVWSLFGVSMAGYNALLSAGLAAASLYAAAAMGRRGEA